MHESSGFFKLTVSGKGSYSGSFTAISPATPDNNASLVWDTSSLSSGILKVAAAGPSGPDYLTNSISGGTLSLAWPGGKNWILQVQTKSLRQNFKKFFRK